MNLAIELKKKEVERAKVAAGITDFELKIMELDENRQRLMDNIDISQKRVKELDSEIQQLRNQGKG